MSQTCPRCGLFNPPEAQRCDCGYDFASQRVEPSYLLVDMAGRGGSLAEPFQEQARWNLRAGGALLLLGAVLAGIGPLAEYQETGTVSGVVRIPLVFLVPGMVYLLRGLNQKRLIRRIREAET